MNFSKERCRRDITDSKINFKNVFDRKDLNIILIVDYPIRKKRIFYFSNYCT